MTTVDYAAAASTPAAPTAAQRIFAVVKLHFTNPTTVVFMPLMILGIILLLNALIWVLVRTATGPDADAAASFSEGLQWSGAATFIFVWQLILAVQAMSATFPYALGFGVTRRDYYLGTALTWVIVAVGWALIFGTLAWIEEATVGWGLGGRMFSAVYFGADGPLMRYVYSGLLFLLFLALGTISGAIWVRFKALGVTLLWAGAGFLLVGIFALVILTNSMDSVANFFVTIGVGGTYALTLVITLVAGIAGFFVLRRATPRS